MATCLVTGVAGFVGSHLAERLIADGHAVIGIDCFTDYYARALKERNLVALRREARFQFIEADLVSTDLTEIVRDATLIFHLAGQAGVRASWGKSFDAYTRNNLLATQMVLEAAKQNPPEKIVFASSSSIYGDAETLPTFEDAMPQPVSPYGVTKLACEHLCRLYTRNYNLPIITVRFFTVYGPRQRPDMAFARFIRAARANQEIVVFGDGEQTRDFTFVADTVDGTIRAARAGAPGAIYNLGGGSRVSVNQVLRELEMILEQPVRVRYEAAQAGDARDTAADIRRAQTVLGFAPRGALATGLRAQVEWMRGEMRVE